MFVQICLLGKAVSTTWVVASIRSFICMNPQMIKEVMPFLKVLSAIIFIAFEYFNKSFGLRILESENSKFLSTRDMLLNFD